MPIPLLLDDHRIGAGFLIHPDEVCRDAQTLQTIRQHLARAAAHPSHCHRLHAKLCQGAGDVEALATPIQPHVLTAKDVIELNFRDRDGAVNAGVWRQGIDHH